MQEGSSKEEGLVWCGDEGTAEELQREGSLPQPLHGGRARHRLEYIRNTRDGLT